MRRKLCKYLIGQNTFDFRPVGQGLFYTGSLMHGHYNFVFDCGTDNDKSYIENQIDDYVYSLGGRAGFKPHIDFVVISHLHTDHFKGLYYLLQKCDVQQIILPYLGNDKDIILTTLAFAIYGAANGSENEEHRQEKDTLFSLMRTFYRVEYNDEFVDEDNEFRRYAERVAFIGRQLEGEPREIGGRVYITFTRDIQLESGYYWQFHFIQSYADAAKIKKLKEELEAKFGNLNDRHLKDCLSNSKAAIKKMKKIYETEFGEGNELNLTSIVLLHFPLYQAIGRTYFPDYYIYQFLGRAYNFESLLTAPLGITSCSSTLLTGDAMIDTVMAREIKQCISNEKILVLQVPHHGSKDNWYTVVRNKLLASINVISFGYGNNHYLPSTSTIDYILKNEVPYYFVTQDRAFRYTID